VSSSGVLYPILRIGRDGSVSTVFNVLCISDFVLRLRLAGVGGARD
jgi:hypothetical protein